MTKTVNGNANANMLNNGKWIVNMKYQKSDRKTFEGSSGKKQAISRPSALVELCFLTVLIHFVSRYYRACIHTETNGAALSSYTSFAFYVVGVHVHVYLWTDCVFYPTLFCGWGLSCVSSGPVVINGGFSRGVAYYWAVILVCNAILLVRPR